MTHSERELEEVLARGYLSGAQYDRIFAGVLAHPAVREPAPRRQRLRSWLLRGGVLATAGALGLWALSLRPSDSGMRDKGGGATASAGAMEIGCLPSGRPRCRPGDTLVFRVNAAVASGYLAAYADRQASGTPQRIWYFPDPGGVSPRVAPGAGTVVLPQGFRIGGEQPPGEYAVTVIISPHPLARDEASSASGVSRAVVRLQVVP